MITELWDTVVLCCDLGKSKSNGFLYQAVVKPSMCKRRRKDDWNPVKRFVETCTQLHFFSLTLCVPERRSRSKRGQWTSSVRRNLRSKTTSGESLQHQTPTWAGHVGIRSHTSSIYELRVFPFLSLQWWKLRQMFWFTLRKKKPASGCISVNTLQRATGLFLSEWPHPI